ncbi:hypothetical protein PAMC26577_28580 [Caballeronia sordidicola]|uniref:Uncharacterized protein n=1 Tax=Caballeronia sordidicola TaxID=196367 RepID=A0A242MG57_CABSO|nr:hypothetical protein PAMC26577_28580 [Caballeronia sordidicola]
MHPGFIDVLRQKKGGAVVQHRRRNLRRIVYDLFDVWPISISICCGTATER